MRTSPSSRHSCRPTSTTSTRLSRTIRAGVTDLGSVTIREASRLMRERKLSAVELVEATLRRIDETEPVVHAYVHVAAQQALAAAQRADAEVPRGPLHGIPIGIKDVLATRDARTEAGSRLLAGFTTSHDATVVRRLREAGAVIIGKQVTHEFACGQDVPPTSGTTRAARARAGACRSQWVRRSARWGPTPVGFRGPSSIRPGNSSITCSTA